MSLSILTAPGNASSASDEMLFIINEPVKAIDPVTYPNYKYVLDIYVSSVLVARMKATPDPTNKYGIFDVSKILQDYVPAYGLKANYANATENYSLNVSYRVKIGEEYGDTLYTNILTDGSDRAAYRSYAKRPFTFSGQISNVSGVTAVASNIPNRRLTNLTGYKTDKWFLMPVIDNVSGTSVYYEFLDSAGGAIGGLSTFVIPLPNKLYQLNLSFIKIASVLSLSQSLQDSIISLHIYTAYDYHFLINYSCSKYTPVTLAWLNPYGAYESYTFGLMNKKTTITDRKEISKLPYAIAAGGAVSYKADGVFYGSKRGFSSTTKTKLHLTSHLLTDEEYKWLADMFESTDVYRYDPVLDAFVPCKITQTDYEYRTYLSNRLTPLEFDIEFSDEYNSQNL